MTTFLSKIMTGGVLFTALLSGAAHADFVNIDWKEAGDNRATVDTETGIEWLKLTETFGYTLQSILPELESGGLFAGWRLADRFEVKNMIENIGLITQDDINEDSYDVTSGRLIKKTYEGYSYADEVLDPNYFNWASAFGTYEQTGGQFYGVSYGLYRGISVYTPYKAGFNYYFTAPIESRDGKRRHVGSAYHAWPTQGNSSYDTGVFLVNDGGVTLSSIQDPSINANNPNAPTSVSVGGGVSALILMLGAARLRRRRV